MSDSLSKRDSCVVNFKLAGRDIQPCIYCTFKSMGHEICSYHKLAGKAESCIHCMFKEYYLRTCATNKFADYKFDAFSNCKVAMRFDDILSELVGPKCGLCKPVDGIRRRH